ncbi:MAG: DUF1800 domain-containing protein [Pseudomonadota bacterium]
MLNRRAFNLSVLLAASAAALRPDSVLARTQDPDEILLNRLTFGATPGSRERLSSLGRADWLKEQLSLPPDDRALMAHLRTLTLRIKYAQRKGKSGPLWAATDELRPLDMLHTPPEERLKLTQNEPARAGPERRRPAHEVIAASLPRAVHAEAQLREVMTQFWHDHFNVYAEKGRLSAAFFPDFDRDLRAHALGNFRELLGKVATAPSMLDYLDNSRSKASPANENFARELLELHTLGAENYHNAQSADWRDVPRIEGDLAAGYVDEDVYEVARAFTGWSIGVGRRIGSAHLPATGQFAYVASWHDPYQKRILGRDFSSNRAPMADGEEVLDMLATHPGTARFICRKIARRLLIDDPSDALVARLAKEFLRRSEAPDQIGRVIRTLVEDPEFADTSPSKLRRPFELLTALYRTSGARVGSPEGRFYWQLASAGWRQHMFPPPTGHPDRTEDWASSTVMVRMIEMAMSAHEPWFDTTRDRLDALMPKDVETFGDLTRHWARQAHGDPGDGLDDLLQAVGVTPEDPLPKDAGDQRHLAAMALTFAAMSPRYLYR